MDAQAQIRRCTSDDEIDRLICRMAAHEFYLVTPVEDGCGERADGEGEPR